MILNGFLCYSASWNTAVITQILNPELTQLTLVDLHPARTYHIRMFATNSVGTSHSSNVLTITTKEAGRAESHTTVLCSRGLSLKLLALYFAGRDASSAPDGPPLDMRLESLTAHSIRVTWKVRRTRHT